MLYKSQIVDSYGEEARKPIAPFARLAHFRTCSNHSRWGHALGQENECQRHYFDSKNPFVSHPRVQEVDKFGDVFFAWELLPKRKFPCSSNLLHKAGFFDKPA